MVGIAGTDTDPVTDFAPAVDPVDIFGDHTDPDTVVADTVVVVACIGFRGPVFHLQES